MAEVHLLAASNAADRGLRALADLAAAAHGSNYRVIGGHMVHLLGRVYPTAEQSARVTADADAGMDPVVAAGADLHEALVRRGYRRVRGNHYEASSGWRESWPSTCWCPAPAADGGRGSSTTVAVSMPYPGWRWPCRPSRSRCGSMRA